MGCNCTSMANLTKSLMLKHGWVITHVHHRKAWDVIIYSCSFLKMPLEIERGIITEKIQLQSTYNGAASFWHGLVEIWIGQRGVSWKICISSWSTQWCGNNFEFVISKHILWITFTQTSCGIAPKSMPQNTFDDWSILVQEMALCCEATSHYLSQCWPRSVVIWCHQITMS